MILFIFLLKVEQWFLKGTGTNAWLGTMVDYDNVLVVSSDMMEYWCSANKSENNKRARKDKWKNKINCVKI